MSEIEQLAIFWPKTVQTTPLWPKMPKLRFRFSEKLKIALLAKIGSNFAISILMHGFLTFFQQKCSKNPPFAIITTLMTLLSPLRMIYFKLVFSNMVSIVELKVFGFCHTQIGQIFQIGQN